MQGNSSLDIILTVRLRFLISLLCVFLRLFRQKSRGITFKNLEKSTKKEACLQIQFRFCSETETEFLIRMYRKSTGKALLLLILGLSMTISHS